MAVPGVIIAPSALLAVGHAEALQSSDMNICILRSEKVSLPADASMPAGLQFI